MGKVNAAMTAQKIISEHHVKAIIFTGVAGAINSKYKIGDIVVATHTFQHDYGFFGREFIPHAVGRLPEIGIGKEELPLLVNLEKSITQFSNIIAELSALEGKLKNNAKVYTGVIATGDQFIASTEKSAWLKELGADAVEMEGAAVAQVALHHQIPILLIRSISDQADHQSHIDFKSFVNSASLNHALIIETVQKFF